MPRKKTTEEFKVELNQKYGDEFILIGEYKGNKKKVRVKHNKCNEIIERYPSDLLNTGCKKCNHRNMGRRNAKTTEEFKKEVYNLVGKEYKVLGEYEKNKKPIKMQHNSIHCNHIFNMNPNSFLRGQRCPVCGNNKKSEKLRRTTEKVKSEISKIENGRYELVGDYKNQRTPILIYDSKCGGIFETKYEKFIKFKRCNNCNPNISIQLTHEEYERKIQKVHGDEYNILGKYKNSRSNIKVKHIKCGKTFYPNARNLARGMGCPFCNKSNSSKGAKKIAEILEKLKVDFIREFPIKTSRRQKRFYRFDFAIFNEKDDIIAVIEYDGKQHFEPVDFFGGNKGLKETQKRDKKKNEYCYKNNIPIYRIPYWEFENIETIINTILN